MKITGTQLTWLAGVMLFSTAIAKDKPPAQQSATLSRANDFSSVEYFPAPQQRQVKTRLSGAEATPLAGGLLEIKQVKLETFTTNGSPALLVEAPSCIYNMTNATAGSPGLLQVQYGDGKFRVSGVGFLWRQSESSLTISNNVHTVIESDLTTKITP